MAEVLFKKVDYTLKKLVEDISMGEIGLPDIQRPFVWPMTKVRDLFDSMYRGFPIGYLLFWENGYSDTHRPIGTEHKQKVARLLIVDGQQRLTSLYAVMKAARDKAVVNMAASLRIKTFLSLFQVLQQFTVFLVTQQAVEPGKQEQAVFEFLVLG
jgi:hypothetical protein